MIYALTVVLYFYEKPKELDFITRKGCEAARELVLEQGGWASECMPQYPWVAYDPAP